MIAARRRALRFAAMGLLVSACGGKIHYPHYYALEIPTPAPTAKDSRLRGAVAVRRFETVPYLREGRIVYRPVPEEIGFYEYHRWAENPADSVTTALIDSLRSSHLFSFVKQYDGQNQQDYLMAGRLERLEEIDYGTAVRVEVKVSAQLVDVRAGVTVWAADAHEQVSVDARNINAVVSAMSQAAQRTIDRLLASLDQQLTEKDGISK